MRYIHKGLMALVWLMPVVAFWAYAQENPEDAEGVKVWTKRWSATWPVENTQNLRANKVWMGVAFTRNTEDPLTVTLWNNDAGNTGKLYYIPKNNNTPVFLFDNNAAKGTTKNLTSMGLDDYADGDTVYFAYQVVAGDVCACEKPMRYSGPNRRSGEGWSETDRFSSDIKRTTNLADNTFPPIRRWSVAGWVPDAGGNPTDVVEFAFEDRKWSVTNNAECLNRNGHDDFDDIVFNATGLTLGKPPGPAVARRLR